MTEQEMQPDLAPERVRDAPAGRTVRDATFDVMRALRMTRIFGNPGSTEIPFLTDLPDDLEFVLALHEGSVVGVATGYAIARGQPSFVNLHTAPGLGNAVNAIANARDCRAPLVIVVGQQDRRLIAAAPFLTGRSLERLAGEYPVWANFPARPQDVPAAIARAWHESMAARGPALVVVPVGDWDEPADEGAAAAAPARVVRPDSVEPDDLAELAELVDGAESPGLVVGAGADSVKGWAGVRALAERLRCPVWQEEFGSRAGFPQDHPQFAGILHWSRQRIREALGGHDLVIAVGTAAFRLYLFDPGPALVPGTRLAVVTGDPDEAHRSPADVALVAAPGPACAALAERVEARSRDLPSPMQRPEPPAPPAPGEQLRAGHVLAALAERLPPCAVLVEETPSSRPELLQRIAVREPLGFIGCANGGLGFGLSGAIGLRMGLPERPVVAVLGDGSSMYAIQGLWTAARYRVGVLFIVMANGGYAVMDQLAGGRGAWPSFGPIDIASIARSLGCGARRIDSHDDLIGTLDELMPELTRRDEPLLLEIAVAQ